MSIHHGEWAKQKAFKDLPSIACVSYSNYRRLSKVIASSVIDTPNIFNMKFIFQHFVPFVLGLRCICNTAETQNTQSDGPELRQSGNQEAAEEVRLDTSTGMGLVKPSGCTLCKQTWLAQTTSD